MNSFSSCLFLFLPTDLYRYVLQYLSIREIIALDSSLINHEMRLHYLTTIHGLDLTKLLYRHLFSLTKIQTSQIYSWFLLRKVLVRTITLYFHFWDIIEPFVYLNMYSCHVEELILYTFDSAYASSESLLQQFPSLKAFEFHGRLSRDFLSKFIDLNPQVERLFWCYDELSVDCLQHLCGTWRNLRHCDFSNNNNFTEEHLAVFTDCDLPLQTFSIYGTKVKSDQSVINFIDSKPSLYKITHSISSRKIYYYILKKVIARSLMSDDVEKQIAAIQAIHDDIMLEGKKAFCVNDIHVSKMRMKIWMVTLQLLNTLRKWTPSNCFLVSWNYHHFMR